MGPRKIPGPPARTPILQVLFDGTLPWGRGPGGIDPPMGHGFDPARKNCTDSRLHDSTTKVPGDDISWLKLDGVTESGGGSSGERAALQQSRGTSGCKRKQRGVESLGLGQRKKKRARASPPWEAGVQVAKENRRAKKKARRKKAVTRRTTKGAPRQGS